MTSIRVDDAKFQTAHEAFKQYMYVRSDGITFENFDHPSLQEDEISYKKRCFTDGNNALCLEEWPKWRDTPGRILGAAKAACHPSVSKNLLYHRSGFDNSSERPLYLVKDTDQIGGLEATLFHFFRGGSSVPDSFGPRFDVLAGYLREEHLGCNWAFMAYLAFLLDREYYFPIRPTYFHALLEHYGNAVRIAGHVTWERYNCLLQLAKLVREKLSRYDPKDAIAIQSYMWVVSSLVKDGKVPEDAEPLPLDFAAELTRRVLSAQERERIGLRGEEYVLGVERRKLREAGRQDLADRVDPRPCIDQSAGYDILSFTPHGLELHIEVKTTVRSRESDHGFWLSAGEKLQAERDDRWTIYRVWCVDSATSHEDLGNIVTGGSSDWALDPSSWHAHPLATLASR